MIGIARKRWQLQLFQTLLTFEQIFLHFLQTVVYQIKLQILALS